LYKVDPITTDARLPGTDLNTAIDAGSSLGSNSNVMPAGEEPLAGDFSFNQFAVQTGGQYFYGRNDLNRYIDESLRRGSEFYTLAYVPSNAQKVDGYRTIRIRMRDPTLTAVTRQGFYEAGGNTAPTAKDMGFDLKLAATGSMAFTGVGLQVSAVSTSHTTDLASVTFAVEDRTLTWSAETEEPKSAKILAILVALDAERKVQYSTATNLNLSVKDPDEIRKGLLTTRVQVMTNKKTRFLRLLVRDSSGKIGTADIDQLP
jgi:hypothetical protein